MSSVNTSLARTLARHRIVKVLKNNFSQAITDVRGRSEWPASLPTTSELPTPAPDADAYYSIALDPTEALKNNRVAVFVAVNQPRTLTQRGSTVPRQNSGPDGNTEFRSMIVNVVILFLIASHDTFTWDGIDYSKNERGVMVFRSEIYTGALIKAIEENARHADRIHDIELKEDDVDVLITDREGRAALLGFGGATFEIIQKTMAWKG